MKFLKVIKVVLLMLVVLSMNISAQASDDNKDAILGKWLMPDKMGTLEIFKCSEFYCGKIVELEEKSEDGGPVLDVENPDETLRSRPVLGLQVMSGFKYAGDNTWSDGVFYIPKKGKEASPDFILVDEEHLNIEISFLFFTKTVELTRIKEEQANKKKGLNNNENFK